MFSSKLLELVNSLGLDGADEAELGGDPVHLLAQQPRQQLPAEHQRSYEYQRPTKMPNKKNKTSNWQIVAHL